MCLSILTECLTNAHMYELSLKLLINLAEGLAANSHTHIE